MTLERERHSQPSNRETPVERRVGGEHPRRHGYGEGATVLGELPAIGRRVVDRVPVEALVFHELARVLGYRMAREIRRSADDGQP